MVYVLDKNGRPLMPTERHGKVRRMLRSGKARVVRRCPFTIQLTYGTEGRVQPVSLGIDAGSRVIGVSASTEAKVLYEAEVELRNDITGLLSARRENRRARRGHKTRYRKPRFDNRRRHSGWLAPSVQAKVGTHLQVVHNACRILPVSKIVAETAAFDLQKLKADLEGLKRPEGAEYRQGDRMGFWNVREYVLWRDGHVCQCCKGRSGDKILNVHHIESRKTGGDAPNNLVTLCGTCHKGYHAGTVTLPDTVRRGTKFKDAAFMGIMRWAFYDRLKETYIPMGVEVCLTYGYITKNTRISRGLEKSHHTDARCISGHPGAVPDGTVFRQKKVRCHNRQIHKMSIGKGGYRKRNQAPYEVKGFRLFDKVKFNGQECFIFGRRSTGRMDVRLLDGTRVSASAGHKQLLLAEKARHILTERGTAVPPTGKPVGFPA